LKESLLVDIILLAFLFSLVGGDVKWSARAIVWLFDWRRLLENPLKAVITPSSLLDDGATLFFRSKERPVLLNHLTETR
jgi:hypothetical protein